jgi:hypothetical protein
MSRLAPKINYEPIQNEYIETEISVRALAAKWGISFGTLAERARREGWLSLRQAHGRSVAARSYEGMLSQVAEQERAVRLEQIAVLRATLHQYAKDLKAGAVRVTARDVVMAVEALTRVMGGQVGDERTAEPKNVTPGTAVSNDPGDPEFWRELVSHARDRVAAAGGVGTAPLSGTPTPRAN